MVFSENGIIEKAKIAKNTIEEAIKEEQEGLNNILEEYNNLLENNKQYQINVQSNLITYNESLKEFPIIYNIICMKDGKTIYKDIEMITIGKAGNNDNIITINDIPSGTTLTIESIYYGASYNLLSEKNKTINLVKDNSEVQTVNFKYDYNGKIIRNCGI